MQYFRCFLAIVLWTACFSYLFSQKEFPANLNTYNNVEKKLMELVKASSENDTTKVLYLLTIQNIDPNIPSINSRGERTRPLTEAILAQNTATVKILLKHGANPYLRNHNLGSPIDAAIGHQLRPIVALILQEYGIKNIDRHTSFQFNSILKTLIICKENQLAKMLIDLGVRLDPIKSAKDTFLDGRPIYVDSPLMTAIDMENFEMMQYLLKKGAKIDAVFYEESEDCVSCSENITVMHRCTFENKISKKITNYLLRFKPNLNLQNEQGFTPLDNVCMAGDTAFAHLLIKHGAKIESYNRSALGASLIYSQHKMTAFLLKMGANPNFRYQNGDTPLHRSYGIYGNGFGEGILVADWIKTLDLLMKYGANPNIKNNDNQSFKAIIDKNTLNLDPTFVRHFNQVWSKRH